MSRALCVIAQSSDIALRLASGRGQRRLFLSYADQVPLAVEFDSLAYWMADAYAARLHVAGLAPALAAPGWDWLSSIDPALLGRKVISTTMDLLPPGQMFIKPAQLKLVGAPAKVWSTEEFRASALAEGASEKMHVQYCQQQLQLDHEHRFVVREGQVLTGSPYRVADRSYHLGITSPRSAEALSFAQHAVQELGQDCPIACSLDVALDVVRERWLIVEANPIWSSGPYACDPAVMVETIEFANTAGAGRWAWQLDATQVQRAQVAAPVRAVSQEDATGYVEFGG